MEFPHVVDEDVPLVVIQKLQPVITQDPCKVQTVELKRYNPRVVPVDVELKRPISYFLQGDESSLGYTKTRYAWDATKLKRLGGSVSVRRIDLAEAVLLTSQVPNEGDTNVVDAAPTFRPLTSRDYNSWLLSLNYHLVNKPDLMKSLPWKREEDGSIQYLQAGTPLPGVVMAEDIAQDLRVEMPTKIPPIVSLKHQATVAAFEAVALGRV